MPWTPKDALRHNAHATTPRLRKAWAEAANAALASGKYSEGEAIAIANSALHTTATADRRIRPRKKRIVS